MRITAVDENMLKIRVERGDDYYAFDGLGVLVNINIDEFALALDEKARAMIIKRLDEEPINSQEGQE